MDRTVPRTGSEEIELYIRTYYSLLRSSTDVKIQTLEEVHASMGSSLHLNARDSQVDMSAFVYSLLRLPACIASVERIVLGQTQEVFRAHGFRDVDTWQPVAAKARRRRSYYDREATLACLVASGSDIDDLIPILTAYQIEWNKLHTALSREQAGRFLEDAHDDEDALDVLGHGIGVDREDLNHLQRVWDTDFWSTLRRIASQRKRFRVLLLASSLNQYRRATQKWWESVEREFPSIQNRPVYFVSSNTHSLVNLLSGFALRHEDELVRYLECPECEDLRAEWEDIESRHARSSRENFLYYVLKKYLTTEAGQPYVQERIGDELQSGIQRISSEHGFDVDIQLIDLQRLRFDWMDPRLQQEGYKSATQSDALIVNIDYPLGMNAYLILSHLATRVGELRGVYVMGKAATLNGVVGDVMMPSVVHDEPSQNTYLITNCFDASDVGEDLVYGTVLDNQKAVSVRGTFLQTPRFMDVFYREGYTDIEMEAGPYLSAVYEAYRPVRYPRNEIVDLHGLPFDLGIAHYASDTPMSKGRNLGAGSLSYFGMDPTYAISLAILRRIFNLEAQRCRGD